MRPVLAYLLINLSKYPQKIPLFEGNNIVGRKAPKAQIILAETSISERHANICCSDGMVTITDLGSKNGVYVGSLQHRLEINQVQNIREAEVFYIADIKCTVQFKKTVSFLEVKNTVEISGADKEIVEKKQKKNKKNTIEKSTEEEKANIVGQKMTTIENTKDKIPQNKNEEKKSINQIKKPLVQPKKQSKKPPLQDKKSLKKHQKSKQDSKQTDIQQQIQQKKPIKKKSSPKPKPQPMITPQVKDDSPDVKTKQKGSKHKVSTPHPPISSPYPRRYKDCKSIVLSACPTSFRHSLLFRIVDYKEDYDYLVMREVSRTFKLLYSICKGIPVVQEQWVIDSNEQKKLLPIGGYLFKNENNAIQIALERVRRDAKIFADVSFVLVAPEKKYHLSVEQIELLVYNCGGEVMKRLSQHTHKDMGKIVGIVPLTHSEEDVAKAYALGCNRVYTIELIIEGCFRQSVDWSKNKV